MVKFSRSEKINASLYNHHFFSYRDLIFHLPYRYEDYRLTREDNLDNHERIVIYGKLIEPPKTQYFNYKTTLISFRFKTLRENIFYVEIWNRPYLEKFLLSNEFFTLVGIYDSAKKKVNLVNIFKDIIAENRLIRPIYSLPSEVDDYQFQRYVAKGFKKLSESDIYSLIPQYFFKKYRLLSKYESLKLLHFPSSMEDITNGLRTLKYEECLLFTLKSLLIRNANKKLVKQGESINIEKVKQFINNLPYKLTVHQCLAIKEILSDLNAKSLMYRLLQGDVGTGKTLVGAIALFANYLRNEQGALMAPTETLARQHYETLTELLKNTDIKIALLTGNTKPQEREKIKIDLASQKIDLLIGTHVLFSKDINYKSLGLAIIDEQHKFGVNQRSHLASKGDHADLLLMSATPIPRTLALTLYGDLDVSTLAIFPNENRYIETKIVERKDHTILNEIKASLDNNKKVFVVAPRILENKNSRFSAESLFRAYNRTFPNRVRLLHGRLDANEKIKAIDDFVHGDASILIATSVIEVGIDVKNANLMIIYHPESFALSSLHQLRGRIGRDGKPAKCLLVDDHKDSDDREKLDILVKSNDGFYISHQDLKRRGPGELSGIKQSGVMNFNYVNLVSDFKMFECARQDAKFIIQNADQIGFKNILNKAKNEIAITKFNHA